MTQNGSYIAKKEKQRCVKYFMSPWWFDKFLKVPLADPHALASNRRAALLTAWQSIFTASNSWIWFFNFFISLKNINLKFIKVNKLFFRTETILEKFEFVSSNLTMVSLILLRRHYIPYLLLATLYMHLYIWSYIMFYINYTLYTIKAVF